MSPFLIIFLCLLPSILAAAWLVWQSNPWELRGTE